MAKTLKELNRQITAITTKGSKLRLDCHNTLVDVVEHYIEHGDTTLIPKLVDAVKNALGSSISAAMNQWISISVTSLKWDNDNGQFVHIKGVKPEFKTLTGVKAKPKQGTGSETYDGDPRKLEFYRLERESQQAPFDLNKAILQLVKRAESALEKNVKNNEHNIVNHAQVDLLKKVATSLESLKPDDIAEPQAPSSATNNNEEVTEESVTESVEEAKAQASNARKARAARKAA